MTNRITFSSTNPAFLDFPQWTSKKISDYITESNFLEADKIRVAIEQKRAAEAAVGFPTTPIAIEGTTYTMPEGDCPTTPEYEALWEEWKAEYAVETTIEKI